MSEKEPKILKYARKSVIVDDLNFWDDWEDKLKQAIARRGEKDCEELDDLAYEQEISESWDELLTNLRDGFSRED